MKKNTVKLMIGLLSALVVATGCSKIKITIESDDASKETPENVQIDEENVTIETENTSEDNTEIGLTNPYALCEVGDIIEFGDYEGNTEWRVLAKEEDKIFLISKDIVALKQFHVENVAITWEECTLRSWLNSEYYDAAFSEDEKAMIIETKNKNYDNPVCSRGIGGPDTYDKVFVLSIDEARENFEGTLDRRAYYGDDKYEWWTRTAGSNQHTAAFINGDGKEALSGAGIDDAELGVRPAIWIDITK